MLGRKINNTKWWEEAMEKVFDDVVDEGMIFKISEVLPIRPEVVDRLLAERTDLSDAVRAKLYKNGHPLYQKFYWLQDSSTTDILNGKENIDNIIRRNICNVPFPAMVDFSYGFAQGNPRAIYINFLKGVRSLPRVAPPNVDELHPVTLRHIEGGDNLLVDFARTIFSRIEERRSRGSLKLLIQDLRLLRIRIDRINTRSVAGWNEVLNDFVLLKSLQENAVLSYVDRRCIEDGKSFTKLLAKPCLLGSESTRDEIREICLAFERLLQDTVDARVAAPELCFQLADLAWVRRLHLKVILK